MGKVFELGREQEVYSADKDEAPRKRGKVTVIFTDGIKIIIAGCLVVGGMRLWHWGDIQYHIIKHKLVMDEISTYLNGKALEFDSKKVGKDFTFEQMQMATYTVFKKYEALQDKLLQLRLDAMDEEK